MAEFPALPLFTDAIIADCAHLSDAEFGLYMRILMLIWRSPGCKIPNDPDWVSRKLARPRELIFPLINEFCFQDGNYITQKRLAKEFEFVKKKSEKNRASAKLRWDKESDPCKRISVRNAPTPTPTPTKKKVSKTPLAYSSEFELFWAEYPRHDGSKSEAFKKFTNAIDLTTPPEMVIAAAVAYKKQITAQGTEPRFVAHAATWLHQRRWEAEYTTADPKKSAAYLSQNSALE